MLDTAEIVRVVNAGVVNAGVVDVWGQIGPTLAVVVRCLGALLAVVLLAPRIAVCILERGRRRAPWREVHWRQHRRRLRLLAGQLRCPPHSGQVARERRRPVHRVSTASIAG